VAIINHGEIVENTSVKGLLQQLNREQFILDVKAPLGSAPNVPEYKLSWVDDHCLEVEVEKGQPLNQLFTALARHHIEVLSMRNKVNRLEELFVSLVRHHEGRSAEGGER